jgi:translin
LSTLKPVLEEVKKELIQKDKIRETSHESMRKATSLSKRAILLVHQKKQEDAEKLVENAKSIIMELQGLAEEHPDIIYGGMFSAALQEYAEANIFSTLMKESRFIIPQEVNVPPVDYVLGLADVIGECRRAVLDALREGNAEKGEAYLKTMDEVYVELMALDEAYMLVPGLRRKNDVARRVIEATRGDVTQEVRRKALEDYLRQFEKAREDRGT